MNYFIEGLQGSGKSTVVQKLAEARPGYTAVREGDYSPVELAWCAYTAESKYFAEGNKRIICYTQVRTDNHAFYQDLEQYEIYNGRVAFEDFKTIVLDRYRQWNTDQMIFECSLLQNTVEDMILFRCFSDEEIIGFYRHVRKALEGKDYRIVYLNAEDISGNLAVIRKERSDENGNELWFPLMLQYFNDSPYAKKK